MVRCMCAASICKTGKSLHLVSYIYLSASVRLKLVKTFLCCVQMSNHSASTAALAICSQCVWLLPASLDENKLTWSYSTLAVTVITICQSQQFIAYHPRREKKET